MNSLYIEILPINKHRIAWPDETNINHAIHLCEEQLIEGICISRIPDNNKSSVRHGYKSRDLSFLSKLNDVIFDLYIPRPDYYDLNPIYKLRKLRLLDFDDNSLTFKMKKLRSEKLESLSFYWNKKIGFPEAPLLKKLMVRGFCPSEKNLTPIPLFPKLKFISLYHGNLVSLAGIEKFKELDIFWCIDNRKLKTIRPITSIEVTEIRLHCCKKIEDIQSLVECKKLENLRISGGGILPSLKFISEIKKLKQMRFLDTQIADSDLSPLLRLEAVAFVNRLSYSHTNEEINDIISSRKNE